MLHSTYVMAEPAFEKTKSEPSLKTSGKKQTSAIKLENHIIQEQGFEENLEEQELRTYAQ